MKIGILVGREGTFPQALISEINNRNAGVSAEYIKLGGVRMAEPCPYDTIIDRISHDVPFYRAYLKSAVLAGAKVINNPFWWNADDKFFNYSLATYLGIAVPKTILLSHSGTSSIRLIGTASSSISAFPRSSSRSTEAAGAECLG